MDNVSLDASIVLPTYNEVENIPVIVPRICGVLKEAGVEGEIIVVDDDSPDGTAAIAKQLAEEYPVRVIVRTQERGLATAVIAGFNVSRASVCVVMDADGSHPVERLPDMIKPLLENRADIAIGNRHTGGGGIRNWPWYRRLISRTAALMTVALTRISDPTSGFMAIKRSVLQDLELNPIGWKIVLDTVVRAKNAQVIEVPITFNDRQLGESKMSVPEQWNYVRHLYRLYKFKFPALIEFMKFRIVGLSGMLVDMTTVIALKEILQLDTRLCAIGGFSLAVNTNYLLNRYWSFERGRAVPLLKSYMTFVGVCCAGLAVRLVVMHLLIEYAAMDYGSWYILTNLIGILAATVFNFCGSKWFAFSPEKLAFLSNRPNGSVL